MMLQKYSGRRRRARTLVHDGDRVDHEGLKPCRQLLVPEARASASTQSVCHSYIFCLWSFGPMTQNNEFFQAPRELFVRTWQALLRCRTCKRACHTLCISQRANASRHNSRKFAEALALAHEPAAVLAFKVVPLSEVAHTQAGAGRLGGVPEAKRDINSLQEGNSNARRSNALLGGAQVLARHAGPPLLLPQLVNNLHNVRCLGFCF